MQTLEWVNDQLAFCRNSEYRWERELIKEFEKYFDKKFRLSLTHQGFTKVDISHIVLYSFITLHKVISQSDYYIGSEEENFSLMLTYKPATSKETSLNKNKVKKLFQLVTIPFSLFEMNIVNC